MIIKRAVSGQAKNELDRLLWSVLWEPLGLPRDIRKSFEIGGPEIELVAVVDGTTIGGIVANRFSESEFEIRHIAVKPSYQGKSVGKRLVEELSSQARRDKTVSIQTWARNTSIGFFTKLGFKPTGKRLEHPDFAAHGISLHKMELEIP